MELVVRKSDLLRELQLFQGIVERNTTIPVLGNVLMEADGNELRFLATDLQVALRSRCAASVAKGGRLTLPAKKFFEIIRVLPETEVRIEQDKAGVKVAADRFDSRMQTMPASASSESEVQRLPPPCFRASWFCQVSRVLVRAPRSLRTSAARGAFSQKSGLAVRSSISARRAVLESRSKMTSEGLNFLLQERYPTLYFVGHGFPFCTRQK